MYGGSSGRHDRGVADRLTRAARSRLMARIVGDDLKPETALRSALRGAGARFRRNDRRLPGSPDVSLPAARLAVFVDGCFWHGCPRHYRRPRSRRRFWDGKLRANRTRDARDRRALNRRGWRVMRVWEHEVKADPAAAAARILRRAAC